MNLILEYFDTFNRFGENNAFCLEDEMLSYSEFLSLINGSRSLLDEQPGFRSQQAVGVLCNSSAETYAAVFSIWFSGGIFIPLNPASPKKINGNLIQNHHIEFVFSSGEFQLETVYLGAKLLHNKGIKSKESLPPVKWQENQPMYVLNTSGSTGTPKNVPINLRNVTSFVEGFLTMYPELNASDKFLQTYELTADAAFTGFLIPFLLGAAVYTVPGGQFKPFSVAKILSHKPVTWVQVTPSLLACLQPFFSSLYLPGIKHFHFGGEPLPSDMLERWRKQIPNAEISNVYGPTETTITATIYKCLPGEGLKVRNNVVSIGKPLKIVEINIQLQKHSEKEAGELFIAGSQVMCNYLFAENQPFKNIVENQKTQKYYPTGDIVSYDQEGNLYYLGRLDDQVKISGYRVDLIEVENAVRSVVSAKGNVAAMAVEKSPGMKQLVVFIENFSDNGTDILQQLSLHLPEYKIPEKVIGVQRFPLTTSGKVDKKALISEFLNDSKR